MSNCAYSSAGDTIPGKWPQLSAPRHEPALDISYLSLRKSIGWIGLLMPWVVPAVGAFGGAKALMSISAYYHTDGRDIFVGSLFGVGVGLFLTSIKAVTVRTAFLP